MLSRSQTLHSRQHISDYSLTTGQMEKVFKEWRIDLLKYISCPGELTRKGVVTPTTDDIYIPVLEELKAEGIQATIRTQEDA